MPCFKTSSDGLFGTGCSFMSGLLGVGGVSTGLPKVVVIGLPEISVKVLSVESSILVLESSSATSAAFDCGTPPNVPIIIGCC